MKKCKNCGVVVVDPTEKCPLCKCILETCEDEQEKTCHTRGMYPNASRVVRKFRLAERLVLFLSLTAMCGLVLANYFWQPFIAWTVVIGLILIYVNTALRMAITGRVGYQSKTLWLTFLGVAFLIGIDALTGNYGWGLNYVLPSAVLMLSVVYLVLIIVNRRNWQSYISMEVLQIFLSLVLLVLFFAGVIKDLTLVLIALIVSVLLFAGTMIFGGGRAKRELYRRCLIA